MVDEKIVMENDINIAKILIDKPLGTKLYADAFGELSLLRYIDAECELSITLTDKNGFDYYFYNNGKYSIYGEPIVFPSKEMRDWSKFSWKRGDILISSDGGAEVIFDKWYDDTYTSFYCKHYLNSEDETKFVYYEEFICTTERYAIEDKDKAQIYIGIIEERLGGKLNCETLEIEKTMPELYDGDIAFADYGNRQDMFIVTGRTSSYDGYTSFISLDLNHMTLSLGCKTSFFKKDLCELRLATEEEKIKLFDALTMEGKYWDAEKKMIVDLKTLQKFKPFDKVIIRLGDHDTWKADFYSHYCANGEAYTVGDVHISDPRYILPYEGNESLLGTANSPK